ncbi:Uracil permease [bioreactor metagenome]|jgi:uracil-xanthine permease|uniref:Uracil permease n=1 Tax=bioreactor metagenome TaxID=1076179 RepID=A0A644VQM3_9ZZZZ|nr:uracil permease [Acidaminococcaceae bacterium]NLU45210.1 uracil permease [Acholeplasmataceae bacterium]
MEKRVIQVDERVPILIGLPLSLQHLCAMFGATILVPFLFKVDPTTCIFLNGIGTLLYIFLTKGKVPAYLGSSFAVISPVMVVLSTSTYASAQSGFIVFGLIYCLLALIIKYVGTDWIDIVFPPAAMGAIIAIIGLELAPTAAGMAGLTGDVINYHSVAISMFTLSITILGTVAFKGFLSIIPILFGVICGYIAALFTGMVDLTGVINAPWFQVPKFYAPVFDLSAILIIIPAVLVTLAEHIGHLIVTGNIVGKDLVKDPGLPRSLLGDGLATTLSGFFGGTPNTTYGENIGVLALTKVYSVWVIGGAAVLAICLSFIGKLSELIRSIPVPVMGGVCLLLFGVIAVSGIRLFVDRQVDFTKSSNMVMTATIMIIGLSGAKLTFGTVTIQGMVLATIVAVIMSLTFRLFHILEAK